MERKRKGLLMVPEESKQPWQRSRLASDTAGRRAAADKRLRRLEQLAESTARTVLAGSREMPAWLAASAGRTRPVPRRLDGSLDIPRMISEGHAAIAAIERNRQRKWDRNAAARARGMALFDRVRAEYGLPPSERPVTRSIPTASSYGQVLGIVPPDPGQTRMTIF